MSLGRIPPSNSDQQLAYLGISWWTFLMTPMSPYSTIQFIFDRRFSSDPVHTATRTPAHVMLLRIFSFWG